MKRSILEVALEGVALARLSVDQYEEMIAKGILQDGAPIELIDGLLVRKDRAAKGGNVMTVSPGHQVAVDKITRLARRFPAFGSILRIQGAIRIPPDQEPEPDAVVVRGRAEDYALRHPEAREVIAVLEVADSSLARDRTSKLRVYATARVAQYVIVNLADRQVEVHTRPVPKEGTYSRVEVKGVRDTFTILAAPSRVIRVAVRAILP